MLDAVKSLLDRDDMTRVRQRSALNPFLYISGIGVAAGLSVIKLAPESLAVAGYLLIAVPMSVTLLVGMFFAIADRDRLQGEEYLNKRQSLHVLQSMSGTIKDPSLLTPMLNPIMGEPERPALTNTEAAEQ